MPDPVREETAGEPVGFERAVCVLYKFTSGAVGKLPEMRSWLARLPEYDRAEFDRVTREIVDAASASSSKDEEGDGWICPGCGTGYVRDIGRCGQLKPFVCGERVVPAAVERAARAIAVASNDGCFEELDAACAGRELSGEENFTEEVCSGADDRAYYAKLAGAALGAAPSVSQQAEDDEWVYTEERASSICTCGRPQRSVSQQEKGYPAHLPFAERFDPQGETGERELDIRFKLRRIGLIAERTVERASEDDDLGAPDPLAVLGEIQRLAFEVAASLPSGDGDTEEVGVVDAGLLGAPAPPSGETGGTLTAHEAKCVLAALLYGDPANAGPRDGGERPHAPLESAKAKLRAVEAGAAPPTGETGDGRESREWSVLYKRAAGLHGDWRPAPAGASGEDEENGWELVRVREIPSEGARA